MEPLRSRAVEQKTLSFETWDSALRAGFLAAEDGEAAKGEVGTK